MKPLVSILVPAYNAEKWIGETIRSALDQTWEPKEIIIVDDGSTDGTLAIARQFESTTVHVVTQANQGGSAARNKAFSLSHGEYIQWLDNDDLLAQDKIELQIRAMDSSCTERTLFSSSFGHFMYRPRRAQFIPNALWCDLSPTEFLLRKLEKRIYLQTSTWLVSRELTLAAGLWDTSMITNDDGEYFCRVLLASDGIRFIRQAKVFYRSVGTSRGSFVGRSNRKLEALWRSMQLHIRYLLSLDNGERARQACLTYLQNYLITFYPMRPDIIQAMYKTAEELGGALTAPQLPWKYSCIKRLLGWNCAKLAQLYCPALKWSLMRTWDRALFRIENASHGVRQMIEVSGNRSKEP